MKKIMLFVHLYMKQMRMKVPSLHDPLEWSVIMRTKMRMKLENKRRMNKSKTALIDQLQHHSIWMDPPQVFHPLCWSKMRKTEYQQMMFQNY